MYITTSPLADKKLRAYFKDGSHTDFGAKNMDDYTITHDKAQRDRYRARHKKDLLTKDPKRAGFLSYYILWGDSTSRAENIQKYKTRFGDL
jgi:hypothetical protein